MRWGASFARAEATIGVRDGEGSHALTVAYAPGQGKQVRVDGVEVGSLDDLRRQGSVFIFVPESLLLVKGSPARRRAHLDAFAAALDPAYDAGLRDLNVVLKQRNAHLLAGARGRPGRRARRLGPPARAGGAHLRGAPSSARRSVSGSVIESWPALWPRPAASSRFPSCRSSTGSAARPRPGARAAPKRPSWRRCGRGGRARSGARCRASDPTATICASPRKARRRRATRPAANRATCGSSGPRANSVPRCWPCCWPSAPSPPTSPATSAPCCSTTS